MKPFEKYIPIYQKIVADYENEHPYWRIEVLVSLIKWSLKSLKHYIEDVRNSEITWASPLVELHFPIEWNWKVKPIGNLARSGYIFGKFTNKNTATEELALKTISATMARRFNALTLGELTNWACFEKRNNGFTSVFPVETSVALTEIENKQQRSAYYEDLVRPFCIGAAPVDLSGVEPGKCVPDKVLAQFDRLDIRSIRFTGEVNGRDFDIGLVFQIFPLIADYDQKKAYHSVVVGLAVLNGNARLVDGDVVQDTPAQWPKRDREEFWEGFLRELDKLTGRMVPKTDSQESVILSVNSTLKIPVDHWHPENRSTTMKKVMDALAKIGEVDGIEINPTPSTANPNRQAGCPVCGWIHDAGFTQIRTSQDEIITLGGILPDIVTLVHQAHAKGLPSMSTKDAGLVKVCGGYTHPCKAFDDLKHRDDYKRLFDTRKRGFISLRGALGIIRNKSEADPE